MNEETKRIYKMNVHRNLALDLIAKSRKTSRNRVVSIEKEAWKYPEKYGLIVRRVLTGMSVEEALIDLEPMEKEEAKEIVAEGDLQCGKCGSKRIHRIEKQTRSADESATVFCHCSECGSRWKF
jgi:DNA-directed RNA polymerase subunit M/transcription elongation factor TFIIS